jgi:hypothetical protein
MVIIESKIKTLDLNKYRYKRVYNVVKEGFSYRNSDVKKDVINFLYLAA